MRRVCCLVLRPTHTTCHPAPLWPQCAAGWGVGPHSAEGHDPRTLQEITCKSSRCLNILLITIDIVETIQIKQDVLTGRKSAMASCSTASSPTASTVRSSSRSKPLLSAGKSRHGWCYCLHSLDDINNAIESHGHAQHTHAHTHARVFQCKCKPVFFRLTYDPRHSFLVGSEDNDPAVLADCDDLGAAAHQSSAGGVVAREVMCSSPALGNRNRLRSKWTRCWKRTSIDSRVKDNRSYSRIK